MNDIRTILSQDHNYNVSEFTFRTDIVDMIMNLVLDFKDKIQLQTYCSDEDILVCMPQYIIKYLEELNKSYLGYDDNKLMNLYFCGLKIQVSFENTLTVFYNAYLPNKIIKYTQQL